MAGSKGKIIYEGSQKRQDYDMMGLAKDIAKGFAMHVCGGWMFDIKFLKLISNDVD
ncbi:hypothetical protein F5Y12DRAFT_733668 [Xylaria sp. FL1777]|nr:hypothetical protein F5Y12DRAFT_733668 [Xylaria sp. FL1777]